MIAMEPPSNNSGMVIADDFVPTRGQIGTKVAVHRFEHDCE